MICEYCYEHHKEAEPVYHEDVDEYVVLCPNCQYKFLKICFCGKLGTHGYHSY